MKEAEQDGICKWRETGIMTERDGREKENKNTGKP